jgi:hypothetical protein
VRAASGLGDLQLGGYGAGAGDFAVSEHVQHQGGAVEVRDQDMAGVVGCAADRAR